jgi:membrane protease subunit HflC
LRRILLLLLVLLVLFVALVAAGQAGWGPLVITEEGEQKLILRLGQARRVTEPGIDWRIPLIESTEHYDARWLYLNTEPDQIQTRDGEQLTIDNYAIWRIEDAVQFRRSFPRGVSQAEKRIDRAVRDDVREVIGRHELGQVLDTKRDVIMREITEKTRDNLEPLGIYVTDVRINRTDLPEQTMEAVYARMRTERERLAKKNRAAGELEARTIRAEADREAQVIVANARRDAEIERGLGDAEATRIYAEAYSSDPDFYGFLRSLEAYGKTIDENTTLVLSPDAEFFRFLERASPARDDGAP